MTMESELRKHRCCFTGHRPEKLNAPEPVIRAALDRAVAAAAQAGFTVFLSGMARGVDLWAAQTVLDLRARGLPLRLICAAPYPGFEARWARGWQEYCRRILCEADLVRYISTAYRRDCFQRRNEWMVDHSARVIAVYTGGPGGTKNTIDYARSHGVPVVLVK